MADTFDFRVTHRDGLARRGILETPHGPVETPVFMPVVTRATVKGVLPRDLAEMGARIVLGNTYHLYLRPGDALVARHGGLHRFMAWDGPMLTDSGGFQVFSLPSKEISDAGVRFKNELDGSEMELSPERSIAIQNALGADVIMAFDECTPYPADRALAESGVRRTLAWLERCVRAHARPDQAVVETHDDQRENHDDPEDDENGHSDPPSGPAPLARDRAVRAWLSGPDGSRTPRAPEGRILLP